jgi:hypothetical protein
LISRSTIVQIFRNCGTTGFGCVFFVFLRAGQNRPSGVGELLEKMPSVALDLIVVKPKNIAISCKRAPIKICGIGRKTKNQQHTQDVYGD